MLSAAAVVVEDSDGAAAPKIHTPQTQAGSTYQHWNEMISAADSAAVVVDLAVAPPRALVRYSDLGPS